MERLWSVDHPLADRDRREVENRANWTAFVDGDRQFLQVTSPFEDVSYIEVAGDLGAANHVLEDKLDEGHAWPSIWLGPETIVGWDEVCTAIGVKRTGKPVRGDLWG